MKIQRRKWHRKAAALAVAAVMLLAGSVPAVSQDKPYPELDQQLTALRNQFNADTGKVRVLFIGDPTCPPCRHGASVIQQNVVSKFSSDKLAVYVVWVPLLNLQDPATLQRHAHQYANLIPPGPRVTHYSDPEAYSGKRYGSILRACHMAVQLGTSISPSAPTLGGEMRLTPGEDRPMIVNGMNLVALREARWV